MGRSTHPILCVLLVFVCCLWSCSGLLVTKNMGKPRIENLENIGDPGKELYAKLGLANSTTPLPPIIAIPGVGGSQLSARVNRSEYNHWYCRKSADWYLIWLALSELVPGPTLECWSDNIMLNYTNTTGAFSNATGVEVIADYFGSTLGFEYVDPSVPSQSIYFAALVNSLLNMGYVRGQNLLGAPYDWRLSPNYLPGYFTAFQQMIEDAYNVNKSKVAFVAHSMGNLFFLTFLQTVTQEWKDQYVLTYIAVSPPWVGAIEAVQSLTSGYDFSIPYLFPSAAKVVQRTFASNYFLLPYPKFYGNQVLVSTPSKNYTAMNYQELLNDLGLPEMYTPWTLSFNLANPYQPPGVNTFCLYGYNVSTLHQETFSSDDFDKSPKSIMGDGDGTVPIESLTFCNNWIGMTNKTLVVKGYKGQEHVNVMIYPPFIQDVLTAIFNTTYPSST